MQYRLSVTRLGNLLDFGQLFRVYLVFGEILKLLLQILNAVGKTCNVLNGKYETNILCKLC